MRRVLLAVDTATPVESVALVARGPEGAELLAERAAVRARGHGPTLLDTIDALLADAGLGLGDLGGLVCGVGPGSFTGLRIALATLKGLALARGLPIWGVPTAAAFAPAPVGERLLVVLDARRGEVFAAGEAVAAAVCCPPGALAAHVLPGGPVRVVGNGALLYADTVGAAVAGASVPADPLAHTPRAARLALAIDPERPAALATLEPTYVRPSDAEINYPDGFPDGTAVPRQKHPRDGR